MPSITVSPFAAVNGQTYDESVPDRPSGKCGEQCREHDGNTIN